MSYRVLLRRGARRQLSRLPATGYSRALLAIRRLGDDPRPAGSLKLTDREAWRIRVGDCRVIYEIDDQTQTVTVLRVLHRKDSYR